MIRDAVAFELRQMLGELRRSPAYLCLASATLALGIAATTLAYGLLHHFLLAPLPFPGSDRLVTLGMTSDSVDPIGAPAIYRLLQGTEGIETLGIADAYLTRANLSIADAAVVVSTIAADRGFLDALGAPFAAGRNFNDSEDVPGGDRVAIVDHRLAVQVLGGPSEAVGKRILLEGNPARVVGVLSADFRWRDDFDVIVPMRLRADTESMDANEYIVARLAPEAEALEVDHRIDARIRSALPGLTRVLGAEGLRHVQSQRFVTQDIARLYSFGLDRTLWMFFGVAFCVLLIAAMNLVNLMALRSLLRSHQTAVRIALGASWRGLMLPAFCEGIAVAAVGVPLGLALSWIAWKALHGLVPAEWAFDLPATLDASVVPFAAIAGLLTAVLSAGIGAVRGMRLRLMGELVAGTRSGLSQSAGRFARSLVVGKIAVATALLIVAGMLMRSQQRLLSVPMGFENRAITTFSLSPVRADHPDIDRVGVLVGSVAERIAAIPGIDRVGVSTNLPTGSRMNMPVALPDGQQAQPQFRLVDAGFLETLSIPVFIGRSIREEDRAGSESVCVVSRGFAEAYLGDRPIGAMVGVGRGTDGRPMSSLRVVGVVGDVRQFGPSEDAPPILYAALAQAPDPVWKLVREFGQLNVVVRSRVRHNDMEQALRRAIADVAPRQPITDVLPLSAVVDATTSDARLRLVLVGMFAAIALTLAGVGLYSVLAVGLSAKRHEYAVRAALGAEPGHLVALAFRGGMMQAAIGIAIGLALALAAGGYLATFYFGIGAADPLAIGLVIVAVVVCMSLATLLPALRAARRDPADTLRP